jgi:hypothetical protein
LTLTPLAAYVLNAAKALCARHAAQNETLSTPKLLLPAFLRLAGANPALHSGSVVKPTMAAIRLYKMISP